MNGLAGAGPVAVIGTDLVSRGWAVGFARAGLEVRLHGRSPADLAQAEAELRTTLADLACFDRLDGQDPAAVADRIRPVTDVRDAVAGVAHVQDQTAELAEKRTLFALLAEAAPAGAVLASSNVGHPASDICGAGPARGRVLVAHPINPCLMPVVEIAPGRWTDPAVVERTRSLMSAAGLRPVVVAESPGLVIDRLAAAIIREAMLLLAEGRASAADIDACVADGLARRWAVAGLFETMDVTVPGGIADYLASAEPNFRRILHPGGTEVPLWPAAAVATAVAQRRAALPAPGIEARRRWRDKELARRM